MIKTGVASITFRKNSPEEVIAFTKKAGLCSIEWSSNLHVFEGDLALARRVRDMTESAGLEVSSYGSYYRLGAGQEFDVFAESALELGTKSMRIWAGNISSAETSPEAREKMVAEGKEASRKAAKYGITLSLECHAYTLTDEIGSHIKLLNEVDEPNFCTYWQPLLEVEDDAQPDTLTAICNIGKLTNIHVYARDAERMPVLLDEGSVDWPKCLAIANQLPETRYAMLEIVKDNSIGAFMHDAAVLIELVNAANA